VALGLRPTGYLPTIHNPRSYASRSGAGVKIFRKKERGVIKTDSPLFVSFKRTNHSTASRVPLPTQRLLTPAASAQAQIESGRGTKRTGGQKLRRTQNNSQAPDQRTTSHFY